MSKTIFFLKSEDGATAIEYALIAGLIFLAIVSSVSFLGQSVKTVLYDKIADAFE
ncbi:Flp family type IVb pilin [Syntrophus aciditrophicus]|uniref:Flp/fap pilin component n=1 Tax=Syntrophus aciditrophicus (strain SB) TaxID=56780 RepID=Q2LSX0_SYNAS|nr:Flp family type IVb pilin [Syntrophus aciditrophicus]ABC77176.1 flp/fap pilin component [Syntrophus aciditrophicus SB]